MKCIIWKNKEEGKNDKKAETDKGVFILTENTDAYAKLEFGILATTKLKDIKHTILPYLKGIHGSVSHCFL